MKNKVDLEKVYRERVRARLTEAEQRAMEMAMAATLSGPLLSREEIKRRMMPSL